MGELLGKCFSVDGHDYTIVDVRNIDGEDMVYAEPPEAAKGPGRAAFRLCDVAPQLEESA